MPTVNIQKDFSKDTATLIALGSLPGRSHCSDTDSKVTVSGGSEDRHSCPRQSLPGYRIPEGLHCHQQSFSSVHPQQTAGRNALCSFSFVPFAYLLLKHARKHFRHESNFKSCFIYLIPVTLILMMLPISNANSHLYKRGAQRNQWCPYTRGKKVHQFYLNKQFWFIFHFTCLLFELNSFCFDAEDHDESAYSWNDPAGGAFCVSLHWEIKRADNKSNLSVDQIISHKVFDWSDLQKCTAHVAIGS